jgi:hypothetical protein
LIAMRWAGIKLSVRSNIRCKLDVKDWSFGFDAVSYELNWFLTDL